MKQNQKPGDWYCPKCECYILGQSVTYSERHDSCGEPVEWHEHENAMPDLPQWVYWIAVILLASAIMWTAHAAEKHNKEQQRIERDKETIKGFSRMSTSPEIQEAYDRLYPEKKYQKSAK